MKKIILVLLGGMLLISLAIAEENKKSDAENKVYIKAAKFVQNLQDGNYSKAVDNFDSTMKSVFPESKIKNAWETLLLQVGKLEKIVKKIIKYQDQYETAVFTCKFEKMYIDIRMVYNKKGEIAGFFLAPNNDFANYESPNYVDIDKFDELKITFGTKDWELPAVLAIPKKEKGKKSTLFPVVILVHGSGPNDMDETIGPNKPFRDLAWGLASKGIATLRYNKRTKQYPSKIIENIEDFTLWEETIEDALEAIKKIENQPDINPKDIYILGHSLGGMAIPRIAEKDKYIKGFILLAANARPMQNLIVEQYEYIFQADGELTEDEIKELNLLKSQVARVNSKELNKETAINLLPLNTPASYWLDLRDYQPAESAKSIKNKMFILQGGRDYQVTKTDFDIWKKALSDKKKVTFKFYPELNHLFMAGDGKSTPEEYYNENHIPEYVIDDIVKWISK